MPQSLSKILIHIIFSTKNRAPTIVPELREKLGAYLAGTLKDVDCPSLLVNAVSDHVHVLCRLSKNKALCDVIEEVKKGSSRWMKTQSPALGEFYWQNGYGAFSVSQSNVPAVRQYIAEQEAHHRRVTFQEEFREFLTRHEVEFDERYVWD